VKALTKFFLRTLGRTARPYLRTQGLLRVTKIFNKSALEWQPSNERIVVLAPHMDDEVIGCGGTLARHIACGSHVTVVFLTDGRGGGAASNAAAGKASIATTRKHEAQLALAELGITQMVFLDAEDGRLSAEDGRLSANADLVDALRSALIAARPDIVYLPFFLEEHPDHRAASALLSEAVSGAGMSFQCHGYEVWTPLFPNCLVRIDETVEAKRRAIGHYQSQLAEADYLHTALGLNAYRSSALADGECRYAEAFYAVSLSQYLDLFRSYGGADPHPKYPA
jgi:LmbE family N-acetylglucosaminyl deacetylase